MNYFVKPVILLFLLLLFNCSGYFSGNPSSGKQADTLALVGGGTLSMAQYNDITPFVFKALNGSKYLFFASDRPIIGETNVSYDIWVSKMIGDKFTQPVAISNLATENDAVNPVIHEQAGFYYMTLVGGPDQTIAAFTLNLSNDNNIHVDYLSKINGTTNYNITILERAGRDILLATSGTNIGTEYLFDGTNWSPARARYFSSPVGQGHGFVSTPSMSLSSLEWYIFEQHNGQHWQINKAFLSTGHTLSLKINGFFPIYAYESVDLINDRTPFVDTDDARVYFASDRFPPHDKYDLYRYNDKTFGQQIGYGGYKYYPLPTGVYVRANATGNGLTPETPINSIPQALLTARANGITNIYVASGIYTPSNLGLEANSIRAGITITNESLRILGGFDNNFIKRDGISILNAQGSNIVMVVSNVVGFYMDGFRLTKGYSTNTYGGGLFLNNVDNALIFNTQIVFNTNDNNGGGGGVYISGNNNTLDAYIANNYTTSGEGAGVYIPMGVTGLSLYGHIINNHSDNRAGGIYIYDGPGNYFSAVITNNSGGVFVGGILYGNSPPIVTNCLLTNNIPSDMQSGV